MKDNGLVILSIVGSLVLVGVIVYIVRRRWSPPAEVEDETPAAERTAD
jgi:hypothetical protein